MGLLHACPNVTIDTLMFNLSRSKLINVDWNQLFHSKLYAQNWSGQKHFDWIWRIGKGCNNCAILWCNLQLVGRRMARVLYWMGRSKWDKCVRVCDQLLRYVFNKSVVSSNAFKGFALLKNTECFYRFHFLRDSLYSDKLEVWRKKSAQKWARKKSKKFLSCV